MYGKNYMSNDIEKSCSFYLLDGVSNPTNVH